MTVKEFFEKTGGKPDPELKAKINTDDFLLAVDITKEQTAAVDAYVVVRGSISGVDSQLNAKTTQKPYLHEGTSTTKTGNQRTFKITGDRDTNSPFQEFALGMDMLFATGETCIVHYIWINALTGKGEKGKGSIIVNSDGSGEAENPATIDIDIQQTRGVPELYTYAPTPQGGEG